LLPNTIELRRTPGAVEVRAADGKPSEFTGRAVVYDQWSELLYGVFRERIAPGAFDDSLASGRDIYASIDHDPERLLGRTSAGTLTISPGKDGIDVSVPVADYSYARDLAVAIGRGDLRGMSFIFDVVDDAWETRDGVPHRTVRKADIYEVSWVYFPAYPQTDAGARGVPVALPVAGEQRAVTKARAAGLALRKARLRLVESEM
jgi:HK97 family phage prohead protease